MSQDKLSLEAAAEQYANYNGPSGAMCMDETKTKLFAFIAGAKFREAQLMEIVNKMKESLSFDYEYYAAKPHKCVDLLKQQKETLANVNKVLNEMGIK